MYFTIGAHTGYRLPMIDSTPKEDYELVFNKCDEIEYYLTDLETGTVVTDKSYILALKEGRIPVTEDLFEKDVLIIDGNQVDFVGIAEKGKKPKVMISCKGFPSFGIWSKPGAPFIWQEELMTLDLKRTYPKRRILTGLNHNQFSKKNLRSILNKN